MKCVRHIAFAACTAVLAKHTFARAPLVSLTVSILSNTTDTPFQATFDRSDYAYPLPQTGLNTFGFAGELYVPESAVCADDTFGLSVRKYVKPSHANGIVFLPYRGCRAEWEQIVHDETENGRAVGALLYSLKDDAAQAAERAVVDLAHVRASVWMVSQVTGQYLVTVMRQLSSGTSVQLPRAPTGVEFTELQDSVRRAVHAAIEAAPPTGPRTFVTISRSSVDVASADRNFFLKAMIGVGITGIVCFVIAMVVRYFDCVRGTRWDTRVWDAPRVVQTKRVLQQHELDAMPCAVVTEAQLGRVEVPALAQVRVPRGVRSCPQLAVTNDALEMSRVYSIQNTIAPKDTWDTVECAICLDELRLGDVVRSLPCPHVFHATCIDRWLLFQSSVCPLCKRDTIFDRP
ncbi:hypothetical protein LPJ69_006275 [Coemansia sp. RSA 1752]|nr:hypothetical protein LPJ69_006275 [Coemansia sp. RSA 1752]